MATEVDWTGLKKNFKDHALLYHYVNATIALHKASQAYKQFVETDTYTFGKKSVQGHWLEARRLRQDRDNALWIADGLFKDLLSLDGKSV